MNIFNYLAKLALSLGLATGLSLLIALLILFFLQFIIYIFKLNYNRDTYWALSFTTYCWLFSWVLCFGYFMSVLKL